MGIKLIIIDFKVILINSAWEGKVWKNLFDTSLSLAENVNKHGVKNIDWNIIIVFNYASCHGGIFYLLFFYFVGLLDFTEKCLVCNFEVILFTSYAISNVTEHNLANSCKKLIHLKQF